MARVILSSSFPILLTSFKGVKGWCLHSFYHVLNNEFGPK
jgi:hypothetical protein